MHYIITHQIEKPEINLKIQSLPLHLTIVPWFNVSADKELVIDSVRDGVRGVGSITLKVLGEDMFGPYKDTPVNRIYLSDDLKRLHACILKSLSNLAVDHINPEWIGKGWNPHVTHKKQSRLHEGQEIILDSIDVVVSKNFEVGKRTDRTPIARIDLTSNNNTNYQHY